MLLTILADRTPRVGQSIQFNCDLDYPLIDAASVDECHQILTHLNEQRYVDARIYQGFEYVVTVTVDGREYLEQISRQSIDRMDLEAVPEVSRYDLLKAASRFWDGDLSGALAAACGAVDAACARVYEEKGLGDPAKAQSFQQKVMNSLRVNGAFKKLESELTGIGWDSGDAHRLAQNLEGSLNQATYVMQTLRSKMSDAHGSKLALEAVVFDSLKWATIIASQLK